MGASHFGGPYERKIGSVRRALEAMLLPNPTPIGRDDFCTLLQVAARVVNSTPLFEGPGGPGEPVAISPSCLLTLKTPTPSAAPEEFNPKDLLAYGKHRWRKVQYLADCWWEQWRKDFLQNLTRRKKWRTVKSDLKANDVVLLRDKNAPRCDWKLAVIARTIPGRDSRVRRVIIRRADASGRVKESERAITDLVLLFSPE